MSGITLPPPGGPPVDQYPSDDQFPKKDSPSAQDDEEAKLLKELESADLASESAESKVKNVQAESAKVDSNLAKKEAIKGSLQSIIPPDFLNAEPPQDIGVPLQPEGGEAAPPQVGDISPGKAQQFQLKDGVAVPLGGGVVSPRVEAEALSKPSVGPSAPKAESGSPPVFNEKVGYICKSKAQNRPFILVTRMPPPSDDPNKFALLKPLGKNDKAENADGAVYLDNNELIAFKGKGVEGLCANQGQAVLVDFHGNRHNLVPNRKIISGDEIGEYYTAFSSTQSAVLRHEADKREKDMAKLPQNGHALALSRELEAATSKSSKRKEPAEKREKPEDKATQAHKLHVAQQMASTESSRLKKREQKLKRELDEKSRAVKEQYKEEAIAKEAIKSETILTDTIRENNEKPLHTVIRAVYMQGDTKIQKDALISQIGKNFGETTHESSVNNNHKIKIEDNPELRNGSITSVGKHVFGNLLQKPQT